MRQHPVTLLPLPLPSTSASLPLPLPSASSPQQPPSVDAPASSAGGDPSHKVRGAVQQTRSSPWSSWLVVCSGLDCEFIDKQCAVAEHSPRWTFSPQSIEAMQLSKEDLCAVRALVPSRCWAIGDGGCSTVVRATLPRAGLVAVKIPFDRERSWALNEARAYRAIPPHKNLVPFLGEEDARIVLRFIPRALDGVLAGFGYFRTMEVWRLALGAARGLLHLHTHGFMHLDVKDSNYLVDDDNTCMLCDLGFVRRVGELSTAQPAGTRCQMAPEQYRPSKVDGRYLVGPATDVWSFGLMLWTMFTGLAPADEVDTAAHSACDLGPVCRRMFLTSWACEHQESKPLMRDCEKWLVDACTKAAPELRLTMHQVVAALECMVIKARIKHFPDPTPLTPAAKATFAEDDVEALVCAVRDGRCGAEHLLFLEALGASSDETVPVKLQAHCVRTLTPWAQEVAQCLEQAGAMALGKRVAETLIFFALNCQRFCDLPVLETLHAVRSRCM